MELFTNRQMEELERERVNWRVCTTPAGEKKTASTFLLLFIVAPLVGPCVSFRDIWFRAPTLRFQSALLFLSLALYDGVVS